MSSREFLEVPEGVKFYDLDLEHYENLCRTKGIKQVFETLDNMIFWYKSKNRPDLLQHAENLKSNLSLSVTMDAFETPKKQTIHKSSSLKSKPRILERLNKSTSLLLSKISKP